MSDYLCLLQECYKSVQEYSRVDTGVFQDYYNGVLGVTIGCYMTVCDKYSNIFK